MSVLTRYALSAVTLSLDFGSESVRSAVTRPEAGARLRRIIGVSSQVCTVSILSAHTHMLGRPAKRDETETESVLDV